MRQEQDVGNNLLKIAKKLHLKKYRSQTGLFLVEGVRFCEEALQTGSEVEAVFFCPSLLRSGRGKVLLGSFKDKGIPCLQLAEKAFASLTLTEHPQGLLVVARQRRASLQEILNHGFGSFLVIDGVRDPGNLGTILRTACAMGVSRVVLTSGTVEPYNDKALRASVGAIFHLSLAVEAPADQVIQGFADLGVPMVVADISGECLKRGDIPKQPFALVVGGEAEGPAEIFKDVASSLVRIPMPGPVESLNVAIAAGILLYEFFSP